MTTNSFVQQIVILASILPTVRSPLIRWRWSFINWSLAIMDDREQEIDEDGNLDELWMALKTFIIRASLEQLENTKWNGRDWISAESLNQRATATDARLYNPLDYYNLRREATQPAKSGRKRHLHEIADPMKIIAVGDFGELSRFVRSSLGKAQPMPAELCDNSGHLLSGCKNSSKDESNISPSHPVHLRNITRRRGQYEMDLELTDELEIMSVFQMMKNTKWPDEESNLPEVLNSYLPALVSQLAKLFHCSWDFKTSLKN